MESSFDKIVWDVRTSNVRILVNNKAVIINNSNIKDISQPLNYNIPLVLYFETYEPKYQQYERYYENKNLTAYSILGAISTFYNSNYQTAREKNIKYSELLKDKYWFRGIAKYKKGYRIILDDKPRIISQPYQGVGLKPYQKPNIEKSSGQVKKQEKKILKSKNNIDDNVKSSVKYEGVKYEGVKEEIPKLYPRQIKHFYRIINILQGWHAYLDTSPMGAGKTYVTCALARQYGYKISVVAELSLLEKWRKVAGLFNVEILEIMTYDGMRGTIKRQPKTKFLERKGKSFNITSEFIKAVQNGMILVFDEIQKLKNSSAQLEAAATLTRGLAMLNESKQSNSRIALLSATPADKKEHAYSIARLLTVARDKYIYFYDQSSKLYNPLGLDEIRKWCSQINPRLTDQIMSTKSTKKEMIEKTYKLVSQIVIPILGTSMPKPELDVEQDYKNGFYKMSENDEYDLNIAVDALTEAIIRVFSGKKKDELENKNVEKYQYIDIDAIQNILGDEEGIGAITKALMAIEKAKINTMIRLAVEKLQSNPNAKVILYFNYHQSVEKALKKLKPFNPVSIHGKMSIKQRNSNIKSFQENNNRFRILIGIVRVGSVGIDLDDKFGNHPRYMFIIPDYRFLDLYQATGRIYRITTKSKATVRFVYGNKKNTEVRILDNLARKTNVTKNYIVTKDTSPFPGDLPSFIEK